MGETRAGREGRGLVGRAGREGKGLVGRAGREAQWESNLRNIEVRECSFSQRHLGLSDGVNSWEAGRCGTRPASRSQATQTPP